MITFKIIEGQQDIIMKLNQDDAITVDVYMARYTESGEEHTQFNLDMLQVNELINEMTCGINKLKELQRHIVKNSYDKFVANTIIND